MYTMDKLPPSLPYLNHRTIIRTGIELVFHVLILQFFLSLNSKVYIKNYI